MHVAAQPAYHRQPRRSPPAHADRAAGANVTVAWWTQSGIETPKEITFAPGETLFFEGDAAEFFFEIIVGTVRCCGLTQDGRRQIYRFAAEGEMLGLGGEESYSFSAEAVTEVVVRRHRLASLDAAMARDEGLRRRVLQALRDELAAVRTQIVLLGQMSAAEKVASFLLTLSRRLDDRDACIYLPMTRADIADYLGLTIETVSRKIHEFRRLGVIDLIAPTRLRIVDLDRMGAIAETA